MFKIGDRITGNKESDLYYYYTDYDCECVVVKINEKTISDETIKVKIIDHKDKELLSEYKDREYWVNPKYFVLIGTSSKDSTEFCTCDSQDLFNFGCKCGGFQREQEYLAKKKEEKPKEYTTRELDIPF